MDYLFGIDRAAVAFTGLLLLYGLKCIPHIRKQRPTDRRLVRYCCC